MAQWSIPHFNLEQHNKFNLWHACLYAQSKIWEERKKWESTLGYPKFLAKWKVHKYALLESEAWNLAQSQNTKFIPAWSSCLLVAIVTLECKNALLSCKGLIDYSVACS